MFDIQLSFYCTFSLLVTLGDIHFNKVETDRELIFQQL